jgi:hypothetical protein
MFRSLPSKESPDRFLPALTTVIAGNTSSTWEVLPSVERELNFSFVVRDNNTEGGNTARDDKTVSVVDAAPFVVNTPATAVSWDSGTTHLITWDKGTTDIAPINCQNVNIKLSIDGGLTFPITLVSGSANDGTENVLIPNNATTQARIMVAAADNIFYNVNATNFTINQETASVKNAAFKGFNLYPNPSKGIVNLEFDVENAEKVSVQLFDIRGRRIGEKNFYNNRLKFSESISFPNLSKGLYLMKITNYDKQVTKKLLIK